MLFERTRSPPPPPQTDDERADFAPRRETRPGPPDAARAARQAMTGAQIRLSLRPPRVPGRRMGEGAGERRPSRTRGLLSAVAPRAAGRDGAAHSFFCDPVLARPLPCATALSDPARVARRAVCISYTIVGPPPSSPPARPRALRDRARRPTSPARPCQEKKRTDKKTRFRSRGVLMPRPLILHARGRRNKRRARGRETRVCGVHRRFGAAGLRADARVATPARPAFFLPPAGAGPSAKDHA